MRNLILVFFAITLSFCARAQELKMNVTVKTQEIKTVDPKVFKSLERAVSDFYNTTQWTEDEFEDEEKIEADFQITITSEVSTTTFTADFVIQGIRPVYGSNYSTQIFNHIEKGVTFSYVEFQPIQNNSDAFTDNLSAILTFYAYIMIGMDYDTFAKFGGDPYFERARNIVNSVPNTVNDESWVYTGGLARNRSKLISDLQSASVSEFREAMYEYHRLGLDIIGDDPIKGRAAISAALLKIRNVEKALPNSMVVKIFSDCKLSELVEIYKPASAQEKKQVYDVVKRIDPAQIGDVEALKY